jgi:hypothetical protein
MLSRRRSTREPNDDKGLTLDLPSTDVRFSSTLRGDFAAGGRGKR